MSDKRELVPYTPEHERVREVLIQVASRKGTISYTELIRRAKLKLDMSIPYDRGLLGHILGDISWNECVEGRPMLSSVALHAGDSKQGGGFFDLAEEIYDIDIDTDDKEWVFGMEEMNKTHDFWSDKK